MNPAPGAVPAAAASGAGAQVSARPRLIVTRPAAQAADWVAALQAQGLAAVALPLLRILPPADARPLHQAWASLPGTALAMFVSPNAVQHFFAARPPGAGWPADTRAGCVGPGTAAALLAAGLDVQQLLQPAADSVQFDSEALWAQLQARPWAGARVLVVRGEGGRDWLADQLQAQGAALAFVAAYRRAPPLLDAAEQALLAQARASPAAYAWLFSSSEALRQLTALTAMGMAPPAAPVPPAPWDAAWALATHPRIAQTARDAGFGRVDTVPATAPALARWWREAGPAGLGAAPYNPAQP